MAEDSRRSDWIGFVLPTLSLLSLTLLIGLAIEPDLIHERFLGAEERSAPLLAPRETFYLTAETLIKPDTEGSFSSYEKDGIWLLQGNGILRFQLSEVSTGHSIEIALVSLPTPTRVELSALGVDKRTSHSLNGESVVAELALREEREQTVELSCEITGTKVDLGRDIRDLCVKVLWVRVTP